MRNSLSSEREVQRIDESFLLGQLLCGLIVRDGITGSILFDQTGGNVAEGDGARVSHVQLGGELFRADKPFLCLRGLPLARGQQATADHTADTARFVSGLLLG